MLTEERHRYIKAALRQQGVVKAKDLMQALAASESTVRRDLQDLEEQGALRRIHGGAERLIDAAVEPSVREKATRALIEKQRIAKAAAAMIPAHATIFLDAGTTTAQMIPLLVGRDITVVTTGVDNASQLADYKVQTRMLPGTVKSATKALIGATTAHAMAACHFDLAFLGTNGVHLKYGLTTPDEEEAAIKRTAISQATQTIVLADPSKFGQVSFAKFGDLAAATILTTTLGELTQYYEDQPTIKEVTN